MQYKFSTFSGLSCIRSGSGPDSYMLSPIFTKYSVAHRSIVLHAQFACTSVPPPDNNTLTPGLFWVTSIVSHLSLTPQA